MRYREEERAKMEIKRGKGRPKGIPKSPNSGRKLGSGEKTKRFLGCKVTPKEFHELSNIMQLYKKKYNLKTVDLIKKFFYDIQSLEKFDFEEFEEKK